MCRLEIMINLIKEEKSLSNQNIFDIPVVNSFLTDSCHQHHFYKYFFFLSTIYGIHYDRQFVQALLNSLITQNDKLKVIENGFLLYQFLYNYGRYELCQQIITCIIQSLTKLVQQHQQQAIIWTYLFRACYSLVQIHNQNFEIQDAWTRIEAANEIIDSLKSTGLGSVQNRIAISIFIVLYHRNYW